MNTSVYVNMRTLHLLLLIFICNLLACQKLEIEEKVPVCIEDKIRDFKKSDFVCEGGARVLRYNFQGQLVYVFEPGNCIADGGADVLDEGCNKICFLGGIAGNIICNEENFGQVATDDTLIWKN